MSDSEDISILIAYSDSEDISILSAYSDIPHTTALAINLDRLKYILSVSEGIATINDDIDIFEDVKALLMTHKYVYLDMEPEYNKAAIVYRFQKKED